MARDRLMTIDPGNDTGWAYIIDGEMVDCGLIKTKGIHNPFYELSRKYKPNRLVIELPQVYPRMKTEPNDLIKVAVVCGKAEIALGQRAVSIYVHPLRWKGTRPKEIDNKLTMRRLTTVEAMIFERKFPGAYEKLLDKKDAGAANNVADAIGIGLWALKRRKV